MLLVSGETGESTEPFPTPGNKVHIAKVMMLIIIIIIIKTQV